MTDYKTISGFRILVVSSDPSNLEDGMMWYNTTSNTLKVRVNGSTVTVTTS